MTLGALLTIGAFVAIPLAFVGEALLRAADRASRVRGWEVSDG